MQSVFPISIDDAVFEPILAIPNPGELGDPAIQIIDPEFSSVCPMSGLPDYGRVILQYTPNDNIVELKSWKLFLRGFYGVGGFHEFMTVFIARKFVEAVKPAWMQFCIDWGARGGLKTVTGIMYDQSTFSSPVGMFDDGPFRDAEQNWMNN